MKRRTFLELTGLAAGGAALGLSPEEQVAEGIHTDVVADDLAAQIHAIFTEGVRDSVTQVTPLVELFEERVDPEELPEGRRLVFEWGTS